MLNREPFPTKSISILDLENVAPVLTKCIDKFASFKSFPYKEFINWISLSVVALIINSKLAFLSRNNSIIGYVFPFTASAKFKNTFPEVLVFTFIPRYGTTVSSDW